MIQSLIRHLSHLEAHHRLGLSLGVAVIVYLAAVGMAVAPRMIISWDAYALALSIFAWTRIFTARPEVVVRLARLRVFVPSGQGIPTGSINQLTQAHMTPLAFTPA